MNHDAYSSSNNLYQSNWPYFPYWPYFMSISTNIHKPYVCDPLGPYISLVNNSRPNNTFLVNLN